MTYEKIPERGPGLRLHLNENTAGCSPAVLTAIQQLRPEDFSFYPDYGPITEACERWFNVPSGAVQLTNGLDEGLHVVAQWAATRALGPTPQAPRPTPFDSLIVEPAFEMYAACTEAAGGRVIRMAPQEDFRFPLDAILASISARTRLVYLTDPNNPTGLPIPPGAIAAIARALPDGLVMLDEAYADFSGHTSIDAALRESPNLVIGRTFAKAHGLAALRIGALIGAPGTLDQLRRLLPPYSLNVCAIRALSAALEDRAYLAWYVAEAATSRELIYAFCTRHGFRYWPSEANFVLVRVGPAATGVVESLAARGIFIRDRSNQPGCAGCVRITAGVSAHTATCLSAMEDVLASRVR
jgi:histidinol-phosphate aminotransferase